MGATKNIMIVGVGGQGTLLASRIIGNAIISEGFDVKVSEVHGMSQRGGSVVTYVRYGDEVNSPIIDEGEADVILAFERLEALRALPYLKKGGRIIVNDRAINPMPVITGAAQYPEGIIEQLKTQADVISVDALALAEQAGNIKAVNVVLLGILSNSFDFDEAVWQRSLEMSVPEKFLELNKKAFALGRALK
ncbi:MAG: indolepyruvate oxidoreductase subunit beta [Ruminococcaceae bacterium]|nr:indolepyruvate oxidoreductase subunit beta [Oscillospiraceae bacterium]